MLFCINSLEDFQKLLKEKEIIVYDRCTRESHKPTKEETDYVIERYFKKIDSVT